MVRLSYRRILRYHRVALAAMTVPCARQLNFDFNQEIQ
jgi:hypothetical protein